MKRLWMTQEIKTTAIGPTETRHRIRTLAKIRVHRATEFLPWKSTLGLKIFTTTVLPFRQDQEGKQDPYDQLSFLRIEVATTKPMRTSGTSGISH